jgi:hypothetical protein
MERYQKLPYFGTLKEAGREEGRGIAGEDRLTRKWVEAGTN